MQKDKVENVETGPQARNEELMLLKRETPVASQSRQMIWVAAFCSLAGVGMGFGMGQLASSSHCLQIHRTNLVTEHRVVHRSFQEAPRERQVTWLGVTMHSSDGGAMIDSVFRGTPAEAAGLRPGEVVHKIGNRDVESASGLIRAVRSFTSGTLVDVVLRRDGEERVVNVQLGQIPVSALRNNSSRWQR